jgi:hypothetical protein
LDREQVKYSQEYKRHAIKDLLFSLLEYYIYLWLDVEFNKLTYYEAYCFIEYYISIHTGKRIIYRVPLESFEIDSSYLKFGDGFVIRKIKPHERLNNDIIFHEEQKENYFLEFFSDIGSNHETNDFPVSLEEDRLQFFKEIIFLFKEGRLSYRRIYSLIPSFSVGIALYKGSIHYRYTIPYRYPNYSICRKELSLFRNFANEYTTLRAKLKQRKLSSALVAIRRFSKSIEEADLDDKIIDLTISIESMFGGGEISYRIALRVSYLLANNYHQRKLLFDFVQKVYSLRNKIVHRSSDYDKGIDFNRTQLKLEGLYPYYEKITRCCIQKFLNLATYYDSREQILELIDNYVKGSDIKELRKKSNGVFNNPSIFLPIIHENGNYH